MSLLQLRMRFRNRRLNFRLCARHAAFRSQIFARNCEMKCPKQELLKWKLAANADKWLAF